MVEVRAICLRRSGLDSDVSQTIRGHPIHEVAPEILAEIFLRCLPAHPLRLPSNRVQLVLTRVCSTWREIALSTPSLWAQLEIVLERQEDLMLATSRAEQHFLKSGVVPLSFWLDICPKLAASAHLFPSRDVLDYIVERLLPRLNHLRVGGPARNARYLLAHLVNALHLEVLDMEIGSADQLHGDRDYEYIYFLPDAAPNLKRLSLTAVEGSGFLTHPKMLASFPLLTHLCLHTGLGITERDFRRFLDHCQDIEELDIRVGISADIITTTETIARGDLISFEYLSKARLACFGSGTVDFFLRSTQMPRLRCLDLVNFRKEQTVDSHHLVKFFESSLILQRLVLSGISFPVIDLISALCHLDKLESLVILQAYITDDLLLALAAGHDTTKGPLCPRLFEFEYRSRDRLAQPSIASADCLPSLSAAALVTFIVSRSANGGDSCRIGGHLQKYDYLKSVKITTHSQMFSEVVLGDSWIRACISNGIQLQIN